MPFALLLIGIIFIVSAVKGNQGTLFSLLKDDFTGDRSFFIWVIAIIFIVAVGNVKTLRPVSNAFLGLVILVIIIGNQKNGNLFEQFTSQIKQGVSGKNMQPQSISNAADEAAGAATSNMKAIAQNVSNNALSKLQSSVNKLLGQ